MDAESPIITMGKVEELTRSTSAITIASSFELHLLDIVLLFPFATKIQYYLILLIKIIYFVGVIFFYFYSTSFIIIFL